MTELVCSETGIPGAAFAPLGAFDPFSVKDINNYEAEYGSLSVYGSVYEAAFEAEEKNRLIAEGYSESEVQEVIAEKFGADPRTQFIATEYNGFVTNTLHDDVPFQVVINEADILSRGVSVLDILESSACKHISKSCDIRWLCFPFAYTLGHSGQKYRYHAAYKYFVGWGDCDEVTTNKDLIHLPGTAKNDACEYCQEDAFCTSNKCQLDYSVCYGTEAGSMPTFCPDGTRGPCSYSTDCESGRCELAFSSVFDPLGGACYEKLEIGSGCNEHNDCKSDHCSWWLTCESSDGSDLFE